MYLAELLMRVQLWLAPDSEDGDFLVMSLERYLRFAADKAWKRRWAEKYQK
jgi:hypothetical protein